ncbi:MAG: ornithine cyclodeaminase family protein [Halobacteriota archaeon]
MRILTASDVRSVLEMDTVLDVVEGAFEKQRSGAVERPARPHYPVGIGRNEAAPDEPYGTGLVMPAYIHGAPYFATKLVSVHDGNPDRGLPTINAQIAVNDAETGVPVALMDGTHVTSARTGAIGGLAARHLTTGDLAIGVVGAGTQARWQIRAIEAATTIESVTFFDLDGEILDAAVAELGDEIDAPVTAAESANAAVAGADLVVTATTSPAPVFDGAELGDDTVVVAIGAYTSEMQEIGPETFERAAAVFADVPEEVAEIGDIRGASIDGDDLLPYGDLLAGAVDPPDGIVVVDSVGSAVMDAATAEYVYDLADERDLGTVVDLAD